MDVSLTLMFLSLSLPLSLKSINIPFGENLKKKSPFQKMNNNQNKKSKYTHLPLIKILCVSPSLAGELLKERNLRS